MSLAAYLAMHGIKVLVLEKGSYPRQRVCGEYISNESRRFLNFIGLDTDAKQLPEIDTFEITFPTGARHQCPLQPGGFGISRWLLDETLCKIARRHGAVVLENHPASEIIYNQAERLYTVKTRLNTYQARIAVIASGRNNVLTSAKNKATPKAGKLWFGVKYHVQTDFPENLIQINLFKNGYCGISKVEEGKYCFCYLADAAALRKFQGKIPSFEQTVLAANPVLKKHFQNAERLDGPVTTANFRFEYRNAIQDGVFVIGDDAGFIPPLTGNGMSLAFRSAKLLGDKIIGHFNDPCDLSEVFRQHKKFGDQYLRARIRKGILLQSIALNNFPLFHNTLSGLFRAFPGSIERLSKFAVGKEF